MKKVTALVVMLAASTALASVDLTSKASNPQFDTIVKYVTGYSCYGGTYSAYVSARDTGMPYNISQEQTRNTTLQVFNSGSVIIEKSFKENAISYIDILKMTLSSGTAYVARRATFISGYELIESCVIE